MTSGETTFDEVWEKLKAEDKTGTFEKAEVLSFISCEALEYAYNSGYATAKAEFERPQGEWESERPEGEWKEQKNEQWLGVTISCPNCGEDALFKYEHGAFWQAKSKFCPFCGAAMRKGGAECF